MEADEIRRYREELETLRATPRIAGEFQRLDSGAFQFADGSRSYRAWFAKPRHDFIIEATIENVVVAHETIDMSSRQSRHDFAEIVAGIDGELERHVSKDLWRFSMHVRFFVVELEASSTDTRYAIEVTNLGEKDMAYIAQLHVGDLKKRIQHVLER
jgi:hypothetical protein